MAQRKDTKGAEYTERLKKLSGTKWKKIIPVQYPYKLNLKSLKLGKTLDVGCGIGRNLGNLSKDSIGVDHNEESVKISRLLGYNAVTTDQFFSEKIKYAPEAFESMLVAHVLEHLTTNEGKKLIKQYLPFVKNKVVVICPQEKGFDTDDTHVNFLTHQDIEEILKSCGLKITRSYSFPFTRKVGKIFTYNETVVVGEIK